MKKTNLQKIFENFEIAKRKEEKMKKDIERKKKYAIKTGASLERQKVEWRKEL